MCDAKIIYWGQYLYVFEDVSNIDLNDYDNNSYMSLDTIVKKYQRIAAIFSNLIGRKVELYDVFVESPLPLFDNGDCKVLPYRFQHSNLYDHVLKMPNVVFGVDGNFLWQFLQNHFQPHEITNMCVF